VTHSGQVRASSGRARDPRPEPAFPAADLIGRGHLRREQHAVLPNVDVEDLLFLQRVQVQRVPQPGGPPGQRHRAQLGEVDAGALGERDEHRLRWVPVEQFRNLQVDQAEVVQQQVLDQHGVKAGETI